MKPLVIYDNKCNFCAGAKNIMSKIDKKTQWIGIDKFKNRKFKIKKSNLLKEIHLISNGRIYRGYYALKEISRKSPFLFVFYAVSLIPGIDFIGNKIYGIIARHRHKLL